MSYLPETGSGAFYQYTTTFIALTTTFTPPPECYTIFTGTGYYSYTAFARNTDLQCLPPEATSTGLEYYSSGYAVNLLGPFTCPDQYTAVRTGVQSLSRTLTSCCPSGYALKPTGTTDYTNYCTSILPRGAQFELSTTRGYATPTEGYVTTTALAQATVFAPILSGYNIAQQFAPTPGVAAGDPSATRVKIGLGVGVGLGVIIIATLIAFFSLRSRAKQKHVSQGAQVNDPSFWQPAAYDPPGPAEVHGTTHVPEMSTPIPAQHSALVSPVELPSPHPGASAQHHW